MAKKEQKLKAERGTALWAMNYFRSDGLSNLLDDLVDVQSTGLEKVQCEAVVGAISKMANRAAAVPDQFFIRRSILPEIEAFLELYREWNSLEGPSPEAVEHRRRVLKALRGARHAIATRIRINRYILQQELDLALVDDFYEALGGLARSFPDLFQNVGRGIAKYADRRSPAHPTS